MRCEDGFVQKIERTEKEEFAFTRRVREKQRIPPTNAAIP
jgi:hypothetical protein